MAEATLTISNSWYGETNTSSWDTSSAIYSGESGGTYYCSKIVLSTEGLAIGKSQKLVLDIELNATSSPRGCMGVLTTKDIAKPSQVANSKNTGPSDTLLGEGFIVSSTVYPPGKNMSSGDHFKLTFTTDKLESDKTYYVYLMRSLQFSDYSGSGFCRSTRSQVVPTLTYEDYYCVQISDGSEYSKYAIHLHDGTSFAKYRAYVHDGTDWQPYS